MREPLAVPRCPTCQQPTHASESNDDGVCAKCLGLAAITPRPTLDLIAAKRIVLAHHRDTFGHAPGNEFDLDAAAHAYATGA